MLLSEPKSQIAAFQLLFSLAEDSGPKSNLCVSHSQGSDVPWPPTKSRLQHDTLKPGQQSEFPEPALGVMIQPLEGSVVQDSFLHPHCHQDQAGPAGRQAKSGCRGLL